MYRIDWCYLLFQTHCMCRYPDMDVIRSGIRCLVNRQLPNGDYPLVSRRVSLSILCQMSVSYKWVFKINLIPQSPICVTCHDAVCRRTLRVSSTSRVPFTTTATGTSFPSGHWAGLLVSTLTTPWLCLLRDTCLPSRPLHNIFYLTHTDNRVTVSSA